MDARSVHQRLLRGLLDSDGVIVARNLRGEKLNEKLAELIDGVAPPASEEQDSENSAS